MRILSEADSKFQQDREIKNLAQKFYNDFKSNIISALEKEYDKISVSVEKQSKKLFLKDIADLEKENPTWDLSKEKNYVKEEDPMYYVAIMQRILYLSDSLSEDIDKKIDELYGALQ